MPAALSELARQRLANADFEGAITAYSQCLIREPENPAILNNLGVALIKAQGLTRDLWDSTFDLMLEKHRMPPVKAAERAEILDYLAEQFPPRRRGRGADNPFK